MGEPLAPLLHANMVSWEALQERYRPLLELVRLMLGVVPNCDRYMMGFLNKFMDAIGVELDQAVVAEVRTTLGRDWSPRRARAALDPAAAVTPPPAADGLVTKLRLVPLMPAAARLDGRWQRGGP